MKHLYSPWRENYSIDTTHAKYENVSADEGVFCNKLRDNNDEKNYIIKRYKHNVILMNLYPYNAGHLLIIPKDHIADLDKMNPEARAELIELISQSTTILTKELEAQGINVGLNLGRAAGAGIPTHLHFHVLPRYTGDTNFLPTLAETKQISFDLNKMYQKLKKAF